MITAKGQMSCPQGHIYEKRAKFAEMLAERESDLTAAGRFLKNLY
jgi:hypothetical protein